VIREGLLLNVLQAAAILLVKKPNIYNFCNINTSFNKNNWALFEFFKSVFFEAE